MTPWEHQSSLKIIHNMTDKIMYEFTLSEFLQYNCTIISIWSNYGIQVQETHFRTK